MHGTSYGGYTSAMEILRHPDVFTAAFGFLRHRPRGINYDFNLHRALHVDPRGESVSSTSTTRRPWCGYYLEIHNLTLTVIFLRTLCACFVFLPSLSAIPAAAERASQPSTPPVLSPTAPRWAVTLWSTKDPGVISSADFILSGSSKLHLHQHRQPSPTTRYLRGL